MLNTVIRISAKLVLYSSLALGVLFSENIKDSYYRNHIGSAVVRIYNLERSGGGTGFHVEVESGKVYILTNNHICDAAKDGKLLIEKDGEDMVREVVARYDQHDLCLVQALPDYDNALEISSALDVGDDVILIGHPGLRDLTLSHGEYIGQDEIELPNFDIHKKEDCNGEWIEHPMLNFVIGRPYLCLEKIVTSSLSAPSYGGNSGSPVVNKYGNVIGVLFAGNRTQVNDSYMVPLKNIKDFLKGF